MPTDKYKSDKEHDHLRDQSIAELIDKLPKSEAFICITISEDGVRTHASVDRMTPSDTMQMIAGMDVLHFSLVQSLHDIGKVYQKGEARDESGG